MYVRVCSKRGTIAWAFTLSKFFLPAQDFHRSQESSYTSKLGTKIIGSWKWRHITCERKLTSITLLPLTLFFHDPVFPSAPFFPFWLWKVTLLTFDLISEWGQRLVRWRLEQYVCGTSKCSMFQWNNRGRRAWVSWREMGIAYSHPFIFFREWVWLMESTITCQEYIETNV